jgi:2-dehydropantoate 2-reductase
MSEPVRFVILGAGAIGGVVGARLHESGHDVMLIARGAHGDAIAARGLRLETPRERLTLEIPVAPTPAQAGIRAGDVVLLCTKSQDTWGALGAVRDAALSAGIRVPVACLQNGIDNERMALRLFNEVLGAVVMVPAAHLEPGVVLAYGGNLAGSIDVGSFPSGTGALCEQVSAALASSRFDSTPRADIMRFKNAKLVNNLGNAVQAVCGAGDDTEELARRLQEEGRAVLHAAGLECEAGDVSDVRGRWERWGVGEIAGRPRGGGSTWQSVARGAGSVETDFLNGEIVLRARLHGMPAPLNRLLQELATETVRDGHPPGWLPAADVLARAERS